MRLLAVGYLSLVSWLILAVLAAPLRSQDAITEQRFHDLKQIAQPARLAELPSDQSFLPQDWLGVISWNVQVGGVSTSSSALRPAMVRAALGRAFSGSYQILAAQEVSGADNAIVLRDLLPGGGQNWRILFSDTTSPQDNGFWVGSTIRASDFSTLFVHNTIDSSGRRLVDEGRTTHPPGVARFRAGEFDFTMITVHLTFADGQTMESARELRNVLDYLDAYFDEPGHDPDVLISGDFNIPTRLSGQTGSGGIVLDPIFENDTRFQSGFRRLVSTVHEPTSRGPADQGGLPRNNYDHFILSIDALEELIQARRVDPGILSVHPDDPELRLTSDHIPIVALFRTSGEGVSLDTAAPATAAITGIVDAASFRPGIAAGSWITIFGTEMAPSSRIWREDEVVGGVLPTTLDGVSVRINGKPAATYFISPGQLNVQAPDDSALGPVMIELQQGGVTTATALAELRSASPGLFAFDPEGRRYLAAVHPDGTLAGPARLFGDAITTRPVLPGDIVLLFGTGFGPTEPFVPAGQVFSGAARLRESVRVLIGGIEAEVLFAGLSAAGLNQLNVRVPEVVPAGDALVVAETQGYATQAEAFLRIASDEATPLPTVSVAVTPAAILPGQSATLEWASMHADQVEISPGIGVVGLSGSVQVSPSVTTTYTVTAARADRIATQSVTLTVAPHPQPSVSFTASPQTIQAGQSATLQWTSSNATSIAIDPGIGVVAVNGSRVVSPVATVTYTLTATGPGGVATQSVTVTVAAKPTVTLTASSATIQAGQTTTLQWTSTNATTASINQGIGNVGVNGSRIVSPSQTTTYTITVQGAGGNASASTTVVVQQGTFGPCGSKTTCGQMVSCAEARYYLNVCKVERLDADNDGVPCESICPGG